jgi:hypothetical protein
LTSSFHGILLGSLVEAFLFDHWDGEVQAAGDPGVGSALAVTTLFGGLTQRQQTVQLIEFG